MSSGDGAPGDGKHGASPSTHFKLLPEENQSVTLITPFPSLGNSLVTRDSAGPLLIPVGRRVGSPVSSVFSRPSAQNAAWKPTPKLSAGENVINYYSDLGSRPFHSLRSILVACCFSSLPSVTAVVTSL